MKIIVYHLDTGDVETFCSMAALLKQYPSMTERRVEWCIRTGRRESAGAKIEHKLARDLGIEIIYEIKKYNAEYRRAQYIKHREGTLKKQKEYDDQHREEINRKARARYRAKCGLKPIKEAENERY